MASSADIKKRLSVSAVIINPEGKVLLFKRSSNREFNPGVWNVVAGNVESHDRASDAISVEIYEETGLHGRLLLPPTSWYLYLPDQTTLYHDFTFLSVIDEGEIRLDDEHVDYDWVDPFEIGDKQTVTFFEENLHMVGITKSEDPYKVLYTNWGGNTRWRFITPKKYFFGSSEFHANKQWFVESYDHEKEADRTYALADIHVMIPPVLKTQ